MFRLIKFVDKKLIYKRAFIKLAVKSMFIISPFLSQKFIDSIIGKDKSNMILFAILNVVAYILSQIIFYFDDISLGVCETNSYKNILNTVYKNILCFFGWRQYEKEYYFLSDFLNMWNSILLFFKN